MEGKLKLDTLDLFCGCGGLSQGFFNAGFNVVLAIDYWEDALKTYKKNHPKIVTLNIDIRNAAPRDVCKLLKKKKVDVIIGGPPCQGFSMASKKSRNFDSIDSRNNLFNEFAKFVKYFEPKIFIMENVSTILFHDKGNTKNSIIKTFKKLGYDVKYKLLNSANYGVPQFRRRVFFVGMKGKNTFNFPEETHGNSSNSFITFKMALKGLPKLKSGDKNSKIKNHISMNHSEEMLKKMSYIKDGGNRIQIPEKIRPKSGDQRKYIKYKSWEPSICVTGDMRKVFHPFQNRALTVRELARLQSFNDNYEFIGSLISQQQQVGDAVPPLLAMKVAKGVITALKK
jgi:DNA (cytosine-5)-methyltransferase 1